ncbi:ERMES complex subunit [Lithohypha guttulata]|uniref:Mitochondrial distribution and morphology protein 34 n=1 Tax=Lithohypha guttulata TaxID=1690604 RepID=A0AAN7STG6_9EURO|nr:ERMES complex subunit [Lithohypha guttulata]
MAFNFNWAPLSGDPKFYEQAAELLTNAMNKNQKPPIIVDDIIVTELNIGDVPPDLEVVEISDIGVDKFRGTFKMSYAGNAFITIKTRVQANPMNTYLSTRSVYAQPRPLAAAAGLTIPLQITLSDFKLSAIIILVFSRQKGLTIVFRNDPLDSLKVSSTFDSIPFVADHLQQVIEKQLRTLFMDELPAIIHRMSLRLWVPEHRAQEERALRSEEEKDVDEPAIDPLASPPQDPVDSSGTTLSPAEIASLSLNSHIETQSLFSRKNLLRLATLTDSHRTLSLFTPNIQDAVFRAWTGPLERGELTGSHSRATTPALSRAQSYTGPITTSYTFDSSSHARPTLHAHHSSFSTATLGGRALKPHSNRKRKKRVVNLRKSAATGEMETVVEDGSTVTDSTSVTGSTSEAPSVYSAPPPTSTLARSADPVTPSRSPTDSRYGHEDMEPQQQRTEITPQTRIRQRRPSHIDLNLPGAQQTAQPARGQNLHSDDTIRARPRQRRIVNLNRTESEDNTPRASMFLPEQQTGEHDGIHHSERHQQQSQPQPGARPGSRHHSMHIEEAFPENLNSASSADQSEIPPAPNFLSFIADSSSSQSIAERAWMMKMAAEVARRYEDERRKGSFELPHTSSGSGFEDEMPPPAYAK